MAASTALAVHFEADDLFVLAHVEDLASFDAAQHILAARPLLSFDKAGTWLLCPGRKPRLLCPSDNDECGRWPAGADRSSREDYQAAQLSMPDFMALNPDAARFRITWAAVTEWETDASGRFIRLIASASGSIDTLAPG